MFLFLLVMLKLLGLLIRSEHQDSERPQDPPKSRKSEANIISSESNNCPHGFEGRSGK